MTRHLGDWVDLASPHARLALLVLCAGVAGCLDAAALADRLRAASPAPGAVRSDDTRRWPAEIENVLSALPAHEEGDAVQTNQQCETLDTGLAHCVRVECRRFADQTACVEVVMTARRLREIPANLQDRVEPSMLRGTRTELRGVSHTPAVDVVGQPL